MNKYHNRKIVREGETYDSVKEYRRAKELELLEKGGVIKDLKRQVRFEIIPSQRGEDGKVVERAVTYVADFAYFEDGKLVVEDTKGYRTKDYIIKRKAMRYLLGINLREVYMWQKKKETIGTACTA